jgi:hypothetical protein
VRWLPDAAGLLLSVGVLAGLTRWTAYIHSRGVQPAAALLLFAAYLVVHVGALRGSASGAGAMAASPTARAA